MKKFNIYTHEILPTEVVKEGWGWPAFFFNIFWALVKKMWGVFFFSWLLYVFLFVIAQFALNPGDFNEFSMADIVPIAFAFFFGAYGNSWRVDKLLNAGYKYADKINAENYKSALNRYRAKTPSDKKESSHKVEKKITSSPGIIFDNDGNPSKIIKDSWSYKKAKDEIDTGQLDSKIWAESQTSRLTSENIDIASIYIQKRVEVLEQSKKSPTKKLDSSSKQKKSSDKPKTKEIQKSVAKALNNDSEYVEKLKEAKSLLDDELINKADYEKIKKKIIDSL